MEVWEVSSPRPVDNNLWARNSKLEVSTADAKQRAKDRNCRGDGFVLDVAIIAQLEAKSGSA